MADLNYAAKKHSDEYDMEKNKDDAVVAETREAQIATVDDDVKRTGPLWRLSHKLGQYGVEERGIERYMPHERSQTAKPWHCFTFWAAANMTVSTFALGTLGNSIWYLGFKDAALTILFFNLLGTIPAALFSTWGPKTGLRQLALSRFSFGYWTVLIPTILNCIACIGWSCINSISGGLVLHSVAYNSTSLKAIPVTWAIVIIAVGTIIVSFMGYKIVHAYEKYTVIPVVIVFLIYAIQVGRVAEPGAWGGSGELEASSVLSFGAALVGFVFGWVSLAADYSCQLPEDVSSVSVFIYTYLGIALPCILIEILGAAAMAAITVNGTWADAYAAEGIGGLLGAPLIDTMGGFGRFCMVVLALSIIANNIPNIYSFALTFAVLGKWAQAIPRPILAIVGTVIYIALAIPGASHFESALDNLLLLLAYWLAIYGTILLQEHYIFRKGKFSNWEFADIATPRKLPMGVAAFLALGIGWAGAALGMSTTFYVGHIAKKIGDPAFGTDLGFELALGFTAITYPVLRYFEKKYWGA